MIIMVSVSLMFVGVLMSMCTLSVCQYINSLNADVL
jgi:hypothetical protein